MRTFHAVCALGLAALVGCGGGVKEETITVQPQDPMKQVKATLDNYARGQPMASEVTTYDFLVGEVRKSDPAKADVVKAGLDDIKAHPTQAKAKAKDLLKKLDLEDKK